MNFVISLFPNSVFLLSMVIYIHPNRYLISLEKIVEIIRWIGPENVVLSSDCGQLNNLTPVEGL